MSNHLDPTDFDAVIGYYNIGSLDRQQEIWDRAITPEHFEHMARWPHSRLVEARIRDPGKARQSTLKGRYSSSKKKIRMMKRRRNVRAFLV